MPRGLQSHVISYWVKSTSLTSPECPRSADELALRASHSQQGWGPKSVLTCWTRPTSLLVPVAFVRSISNLTVHCPSLLPEESLKYPLRIAANCRSGFPLQPFSPPLQKKSHHRIQHYLLISLGKVLKYMIKSDLKFDLSPSLFPWKGVLLLLMSGSDSPNRYSAHAECCWHYWLYLEAHSRINTNSRQRPLGFN